MGRIKNRLGRRVMAVALSLAMIMSNMTVYASELSNPKSETTIADEVETEETKTESLTKETDESTTEASDEETADSEDGKTSDDEEKDDSKENGKNEEESSADASSESDSKDEKQEDSAKDKVTKETTAEDDEIVQDDEEVKELEEGEDDTPTTVPDTAIRSQENASKGIYVLDTTYDGKIDTSYTANATTTKGIPVAPDKNNVDIAANLTSGEVGTDGRFEIVYGSGTVVAKNEKTFNDNCVASNRIALKNNAQSDGTGTAVKFSINSAARVKVYWSSNVTYENDKDADRYYAILLKKGDEIKEVTTSQETDKLFDKNTVKTGIITVFDLAEKGEYYLLARKKAQYFYGIVIEELPEVTVSGEVTLDKADADLSFNFKTSGTQNVKNGDTDVYTGIWSDEATQKAKTVKLTPKNDAESGQSNEYVYTYSINLPKSYIYDVTLSGTDAGSYNISADNKGNELSLAEDVSTDNKKTYSPMLESASKVTLKGTITGLDKIGKNESALEANGSAKIVFTPKTNGYETKEHIITKNDDTYELELDKDIVYDITTEGLNDHELTSSTGGITITDGVPTITLSSSKENVALTYALKATYEVTVNAKDTTITAENLKGAKITITNTVDNYVYELTVTGGNTNELGKISLRNGTYTVEVTNSGDYKQKLGDNLTVNNANVASYPIEFTVKAPIVEEQGDKYILNAEDLMTNEEEKDDKGNYQKPFAAKDEVGTFDGEKSRFVVAYRHDAGSNGTSKQSYVGPIGVDNKDTWLDADGDAIEIADAPDLNDLNGINFGGTSASNGMYIQFNVASYAQVKIFWSPNKSDPTTSHIGIKRDGTNTKYENVDAAMSSEVTGDNKHGYVSIITVNSEGTYNIVWDQNSRIYKVVITEVNKGARKEWTQVTAPSITAVTPNTTDKTKLDVKITADVSYNGGDKVVVTMKDAAGNEVGTGESSTEGSEHTVSITPSDSAASGKYTFVAALKRENETDKGSTEFEYDYKKPLSAPSVEVSNRGQGVVVVSWKPVDEATSYIVTVKDGDTLVDGIKENVASNITSVTIDKGLTIDKTYTFIVTAVKGNETVEGSATVKVTSEGDVEDEHILDASEYEYSYAAIPLGTTFDKGYFVVTGSVKSDAEKGYFELAKSKGGSFRFRITGTATVIISTSSTGSNPTALLLSDEAGKNYIAEGKTTEIVELEGSTSPVSVTYKLEAGIYHVYGASSDRGTRIYSIDVIEKNAQKISRSDWGGVAAPKIGEPKQTLGETTMTVPVTMEIGDNGADYVRAEVRLYEDAKDDDEETKDDKDTAEDDENTTEDSEQAKYKVVASGTSVDLKSSHSIKITPGASAYYTIAAVAVRNDEETEKETVREEEFLFRLPLTKPEIASVTSGGIVNGENTVEVEWREVLEADAYIITAKKAVAADKTDTKAAETTATDDIVMTVLTKELPVKGGKTEFKAVVSSDKFVAGQKYAFTVQAKRYEESVGQAATSEISDAKEVLVTDDGKTKWGSIIYGSSTTTDTKKDGFRNIVYNDTGDLESVDVYSISNGGKIVPNSTDGIAFWYTETNPTTDNFTLIATAKVNNWTYSNGQEGFGLIVTDRIPEASTSDMFWNNSYMAMVSKVEYFWDGEQVTDAGNKISMYLGVGSLEKQGVTDVGLKELADGATIPTAFTTLTQPLETSCANSGAGTYNLVGGYTNDSVAGTVRKPYTEFTLKITKNNTGYFVSYWDPNKEGGAGWNTNKYYDTEALSQLNKDTVYVGFFASRNADITFKDITFIRNDPENQGPAEARPTKYVTPLYQMLSASTANTENHELIFNSNWNGTVAIKDSLGNSVLGKDENGKVIQSLPVKGNLDTSPDAYDKDATAEVNATVNETPRKIKVTVPLSVGTNEFTVTFTPDSSWAPNSLTPTQLSDYSTQSFVHKVSYRKYGDSDNYLYVANNGKTTGLGTKDDPLDIYTAVKYVQAGQTIVLKSGTYNLTRTVTTARGTSGTFQKDKDGNLITDENGKQTVDKYIYMIAEEMPDPTQSIREVPQSNVVFDFGGRCPGMVFAGDAWYFKGFDVTNSSDGDKGIQVSGNYNVLDQLRTYKNGNTGIQISRYHGTDTTQADWPSYNKILNCTSYLNADSGYEDADGFSAKLTVGVGNVFDGCISFYNADDGWDLFAKAETGLIGMVTIQNSVAFKNGFVLRANDGKGELDINGVEVNAGNGNGFKMGGESLSGKHTLRNSIAFDNKAKGFDCNSCPDIQVYNSISFNNENYNVAFYTNNAPDTGFIANGVISYRTKHKDIADQIKLKGKQVETDVKNATYFQWRVSSEQSKNFGSPSTIVEENWFKSIKTADELDSEKRIIDTVTRNADGTINTNDFLQLTDKAVAIMQDLTKNDDGFNVGGEKSDTTLDEIDDKKFTDGVVDKGDEEDDTTITMPDEDLAQMSKLPAGFSGLWMVIEDENNIYYTGKAVQPTVRVYMGSTLLTQGTEYTVKYKNNTHANKTKGTDGNYTVDIRDAKGNVLPTPTVTITGAKGFEGTVTKTFEIKAVDLSDTSRVCVTDYVDATNGRTDLSRKSPTVTYNGKTLTKGKDYVVELTDAGKTGAYKSFNDLNDKTNSKWKVKLTAIEGSNFTGSNDTAGIQILNKNDVNNGKIVLVSKLKIETIKPQQYAGGAKVEPAIVVKNGKSVIAESATTYDTPVYANQRDIGTASVTITGAGVEDENGVRYIGSKTVTYKIIGGAINDKNFDFVIWDAKYGTIPMSKGAMLLTVPYKGQAIKFGKVTVSTKTDDSTRSATTAYTLTENKDYTVTYTNNAKAGTATITIKGINDYSGSFRKNFKIAAFDISSGAGVTVNNVSREVAEVDSGLSVPYTQGGAVLSNGILKIDNKVVNPRDYKVSYKYNKASYQIVANPRGEIDSKAPTATITGRNGLRGTIKVRFSIDKKELGTGSGITVAANDIVWKENANASYYESKIVVKEANGKTVSPSEYTVEYYLDSESPENLLVNKYNTLNAPLEDVDTILGQNGRTIIAKVVALTDTSSKRHSYTGHIYKEYRIVRASIKDAKVKVLNPKYYGVDNVLLTKDLEVSLAVKTKEAGNVISQTRLLTGGYGNDYVIESITGNGRVGTAKATLRGVGMYGGTRVVSYQVRRQSWNISKAVVDGQILVPVESKADIIGMTLTEKDDKGDYKYANDKGDCLLTDKIMMNGRYMTFYDDDGKDAATDADRTNPTNEFVVSRVYNQQFEEVASYVYPSLTSRGTPVYERDEEGHYKYDTNGRRILIGTGYKVTVTLQGINSYGGQKKISFIAYVPVTTTETTPETE